MAEVIAFLIEHFQDFDACPPSDDLGQILEDVGFDDVDIGNALMLLDVLREGPGMAAPQYRADAMRIYGPEELDALPQEVLGLLHFLEKAGAVNGEQREFVVHALLHMPSEEISVDMAKVLTLLVLWAHKSELPVLIGDELMMALHGKAVMH
ncbi:DUF494 domain-containing protein [Uruburuella testudinis]|uniref:Protein Smg homolog n=1 Tax=Uruburuella testudinis TaxID=1282863 RepID=A0ABY4DWW7_9NEIS|nr:DUF494 domain-containing protein [Uruburuella testudinis]UOO83288.1 DUF494 domain-containing protein [Uruburuella testudinis]